MHCRGSSPKGVTLAPRSAAGEAAKRGLGSGGAVLVHQGERWHAGLGANLGHRCRGRGQHKGRPGARGPQVKSHMYSRVT